MADADVRAWPTPRSAGRIYEGWIVLAGNFAAGAVADRGSLRRVPVSCRWAPAISGSGDESLNPRPLTLGDHVPAERLCSRSSFAPQGLAQLRIVDQSKHRFSQCLDIFWNHSECGFS